MQFHDQCLDDFPPKLGLKMPKNRKIGNFLLSGPQIGGCLEPPWGLNLVGMVLKVAGGNFVHTVKISGQLN